MSNIGCTVVGTKELINPNPWEGGGVYDNSHIKLHMCSHLKSALIGLVLGFSFLLDLSFIILICKQETRRS